MKLFSKTLIFLLLSTSSAFATNNAFMNHQELKNEARVYLTNKLSNEDAEYSIKVNSIDQRLKLQKCTADVEIELTQPYVKAGRNTLSVRCLSDVPWRIFMTAHVKLFAHALVSLHPLNKGHLIQEHDVTLKKVELNGLRSAYLTDSKQALNKVIKRRLKRGDIISVNNLSKPILIKKGDAITILAKNNGFKISMKGIALMSGSKGDKIKVKNIKTKKIVHGIIFDAQTIQVKI
ncbi:MAG: flagellar biosynthesis protein FlgA [Cycloclasticus sp. symbiont of Bathymodiolus heckerae]|nr:MAG: flagellar biosynthesis protein FlgA [Cycloclasticus sp. symbiont of Bathymodiolus heckerae]